MRGTRKARFLFFVPSPGESRPDWSILGTISSLLPHQSRIWDRSRAVLICFCFRRQLTASFFPHAAGLRPADYLSLRDPISERLLAVGVRHVASYLS